MNITSEDRARAEMLISFFNLRAGTRYRTGNENNHNIVLQALRACDNDVQAVKGYIKEEIAFGNKSLDGEFFAKFLLQQYQKRNEKGNAVETKEEETAPAPVDNLTASMNFMGQVVMELLAKTKLEDIRNEVGEKLRKDVQQFVFDNYGIIQRKVVFELPEKKVELEGVIHSKFDTVLKFVQANEPVFLTGPAGSGKNVLCQQIAKTLGLNFYFSNAVTQEYKITGFTDAMGVFHESQFYKAFKNGGLFMLDEMDASIPEVLIILNAAIANRYFDFPAPIGYVEAHKDFRVVAAGNTFGNGADYDYVGRNQLDAASLDRFAQVRIDYDAKIEENCANGDTQLLNFCRKFRQATKEAGIRTVVSYRAISRMAKLTQSMEAYELLDSCLIKSLETDDLNAIKGSLQGCGKYSEGFNKILESRKES